MGPVNPTGYSIKRSHTSGGHKAVNPFANAGCLHYDKDSNKLFWNESPDILHGETTTILGDINDIKTIAKNLTIILTKKFLKGNL